MSVPITPSSSRQIDALVADLASPEDVRRDAAVARLTVIGPRAVGRLAALAGDASAGATARAAAFRALEAIGDPAAIDPVLACVDHAEEPVALAAIDGARAFLPGSRGVEITDRLAGVALDRERPATIRLAAIRALRDLDAHTVAPLLAAIREDPALDLSDAAGPKERELATALDPVRTLAEAATGALSDDPARLRRAIALASRGVPLESLRRIIDRVRDREGAEAPARRGEWQAARAAAHLALARRGSRVALYDLRESLESAKAPLPVELIAAVREIGDVSCLEPIAAAYGRARAGKGDAWWREHLADAFRAIAAREGVTRRHAVMRKIEKRWGLAI